MAQAQMADRSALESDFSLLIDGELVSAAERLDVINPASGKVVAQCPAAGRAELDRAVRPPGAPFLSGRHARSKIAHNS
jgi:acyl-CoA reductase-like NAD-dependent aldehyde dehydrogenase